MTTLVIFWDALWEISWEIGTMSCHKLSLLSTAPLIALLGTHLLNWHMDWNLNNLLILYHYLLLSAPAKMVMHLHVIYKIYMKRYEKNPKSAMSLSKGNKCVSKIYVVSREHLVMVHLRAERFHSSTYQKLQAKKMGPFRVLKWLGENAYLLEFPLELHCSLIFNVGDLFIYRGHQNEVSEELDLQLSLSLSPCLEIEYVLDD